VQGSLSMRTTPPGDTVGTGPRQQRIPVEHTTLRHANGLESVLTDEGTSEMHSLVTG
jgi:hypothetical protein